MQERRQLLFWIITLSGLISGAIAIVISIKWYVPLLEACGHALFIASFLSLTVDRYVKWKMLKEVSQDVSQFLIGYQLPPEAQDKIRELMGCRIIRKDLAIHFTVAQLEEAHKVRVTVTFSFSVANITNEEQPYQQFLHVDKHDNPVIRRLECDSSDQSARYRLEGGEISHDKPGEPGVVEALGKKLSIKPNREGQPFYRVGATYAMILPEEYSDVFAFGGPTLKVRITAEVPEKFTFYAPDADVETTNSWEYNKFYLPNQHVRVRWFKGNP